MTEFKAFAQDLAAAVAIVVFVAAGAYGSAGISAAVVAWRLGQ